MDADDIKRQYTMREIVERYGIRIDRKGFCKCPFHNEKTGSMKIYKDSFYCFGCGQSGDIFTFVQKMDGISFKEAYKQLGGEYEHVSQEKRINDQIRRKREADARAKREQEEEQLKQELGFCLTLLRVGCERFEPMSDDWTYCQNEYPVINEAWDKKYCKGENIDEFEIHRKCVEIRRRFNIAR